ncbi:MAG TPA: cation:proton antiporter, partial [Vicinamibacteria bacterium]|nr:cation:proton antiporter [Vicinamibacteria bacterium]
LDSLLAAAGQGGHHAVPRLLAELALIIVGAKVGAALATRAGLPGVLGELLAGLLLGNLALLGGPDLRGVMDSDALLLLSELGAVLLLFKVGLESAPSEMMAVGGRATAVAAAGVVTPMALGFALGELMRPDESWMLHAFLGSMLAATSVGITARVLADAGAVQTPAARIVLGAAVIDDVMGLVVLAVVSGIINAAGTGSALAAGTIVWIVVKAVLFLFGALAIGGLLAPRLFKTALILPAGGVSAALALALCLLSSYLAALAGLAPIVGAFAAGLVLEEKHAVDHIARGERPLEESLGSLSAFLVPVFFVRMGMLVDLSAFASGPVLGFAALLTLAAVIGKQVCGLLAPRGVSGLVIGIGMMPRGEVGLIFAGIGAKLMLDGRPVVDAGTYAAAVFMVMATSVVTPPLLQWALRRSHTRPAAPEPTGP